MATYAFGESTVDSSDLRIGVLGALLLAGTALASGVAIVVVAQDDARVTPGALGEPRAPLVVYERGDGPGSQALKETPLGSLQVRRALVSPAGAQWRIQLSAAGAPALGIVGANPPARYAAVVGGQTLGVGTVVGDPSFDLFLFPATDRERAVEIARSLTTQVEVAAS